MTASHEGHDPSPNPFGRVKTHVVNGEYVIPPVVVAARDRHYAVIWCPWCDAHHSHGAANGGRVAHCFVKDSPYRTTGYLIQLRDDITPDQLVPPRSERRRPRKGPFGHLIHGWDGEPRHRWLEPATEHKIAGMHR